jgi:galactokinase
MVVRAPGRVNLIGEHTDYNDGFVMPMAINRAVWIALEPVDTMTVEIYSLNYENTRSFSLGAIEKADMSWVEYVKGVAWALRDAGLSLKGWRGTMIGDVPLGAGLSSSAAVELAVGRAFNEVAELGLSPTELALLGQKAENKWVGVNCGIMDQMISSAGQTDHALMIDCRSLELHPVPLPEDMRVVILDTATRRGLSSSAYNERRSQCEKGARIFGKSHLRDVGVEEFEARAGELDPLTRRRCRHVVTENDRVMQAVDALTQGDAETFGKLMQASHASLRDDFEVSCDELDAMVEIAMRQPDCLGARMTGAGFGGCAVAWVQADGAEAFAAAVAEAYEKQTGIKPNVYVCNATQGAAVVHDLAGQSKH